MSGPGAGHHLELAGRPILLVGDSVTQGWAESGEDFDQERYVHALATRGVNVLHLWTFIGPQTGDDERLGCDAPEIVPWERSGDGGWDLRQFNDTYFSRLERLCSLARDSSIVVILQVFDGWTKTRFATHPFRGANGGPLTNRSQFVILAEYDRELPATWDGSWSWRERNQFCQERYAARLIEATSSYGNVLYELFNEGEWYEADARRRHEVHFLAFFKARCRNLLFSNDDHIGGDDFRGEPNNDIISLHRPNWSCSTGAAVSFDHFRGEFSKAPVKPVFFSEPVPEFGAADACEVEAMTRVMWGTTLGGAGFIVQNDASFGFNPKARISSRAELRDRMLDREGACARFFNELGVGWVSMEPAATVSSTRVALARPGQEYVVYSESGASFTMDLSPYAATSFEARFYDPRGGRLQDPMTIHGGDRATPIDKPDTRDWVFWLRRFDR